INGIDDNCNGLIDETNNFHFRTRGNGNWRDTASWEYLYAGIWRNAARIPNNEDSSILIKQYTSVTLNTAENLPKLTIEQYGELRLEGVGDVILLAPGNTNRGSISMNSTGGLRPKTNGHTQALFNYGALNWNSGPMYTGVFNYGTFNVRTSAGKNLYAPIYNYATLNCYQTSITAGSPSATIINTGQNALGTISAFRIIGPAGRSAIRNENGASLSIGGNTYVDRIENSSRIIGSGKLTANSLNNTGIVYLPWGRIRGEFFHSIFAVNSVSAPTGIFELQVALSNDGTDMYTSEQNIDLSKIKLNINQIEPGIGRADTIIKSYSGVVSGEFNAAQVPSGFSLRKGSNFVVIENSTTLNAAAITQKPQPIENPFIPTIQRRSQTFRIQGLQAPAHAVLITDITGRHVFSARGYGNNISLNKLSPGIHFYRVTTREGKVYTGKIMITD
ncbi:MAG: T9SS type A sorting domain-containing protein, partial [Pedobacter sp.]